MRWTLGSALVFAASMTATAAAAAGLVAQEGRAGTAVACERLTTLQVAETSIASAEIVAAGTFDAPVRFGPRPDYSKLPAFCRVAGSIRPSEGSDIGFEVWLPSEGWNGRFMQTGNGGAAGAIVHASLADPLARGYAVANTDTGHRGEGGDFSWAVGHPEKLVDYQHRAVHELTRVGKAITEARYGTAPERSYWVGCSTGGRQGLKEAQLHPGDYDGIVAGAPASNWSPLMGLSVHIQKNLGPGGLAVEKLGLLREAAIAACDADDGVADRVIANPGACDFDPASLKCAAGPSGECLSGNEVAAARRIYAGLVDSEGEVLIPGTGPGSEPAWAAYVSPGFRIGASYFQNVVAGDPDWDPETFDVDRDVARSEAADGGAADAMDPDLSEFVARGGKLITYHGTTDGLIPFGNSVSYFGSVVDVLGQDAAQESVRLYLVPGMNHCFGGEGAFVIDWLTALEEWVEEGNAPAALHAVHPAAMSGAPGEPAVESAPFTRPVCPYPQAAEYRGNGDSSEAASFRCVAP